MFTNPERAMRRWQGLDIKAEGTGISEPLSEQVNLLGSLLGEAIREQGGAPILELVEELRGLCKQAAQEGRPELREQARSRIAALSLDEIGWLLRSFTSFFHLVNQAEQQEIVRINRERARQQPDRPRPDSIDEAVYLLKSEGCSLNEVLRLIERLDIQPTLTAHPTEARRRTILYKQQEIAARLDRLQQCKTTPEEYEALLTDIYNQIALLLSTDEVRASRPTVEEEVENGLYFLRNTIWHTVPRIHQDLRNALRLHYGEAPELPIFLRFRSWIGSDRDGNPFVTADITRRTIAAQRRTALWLFLEELRELRREISLSDRQAHVPRVLYESIQRDAEQLTIEDFRRRQFQHEPYRMKISYMMARLEQELDALDRAASPGYDSARFLEDLNLLARCLEQTGFGDLVHYGRLGRLLIQAQTFGFHLVALDVRQHSRVHEEAVATLLRVAGVVDDYAGLSEEERLRILSDELANPRPLLPHGTPLPETTREVIDTLAVVREAIADEPAAIGSYIVSMTHAESDLLEVMLLAKEVGLWRQTEQGVVSPLDVVPLFETIEDLDRADAFLDKLFAHPVYRRHLAARGGFQEIMLGYSDSNKDGGYWMANWALHQAQERIGSICRKHDVDFRLFHGRGGTVGRGGGRAGQGIRAMPGVVHNGRIRFTEQGEVISFRYALQDIARRHLEQIVNAMLLATASSSEEPSVAPEARDARLMDRIAQDAMQAYRALVHDDEVWTWYTSITPIEQISRLPIASRPVSRKAADEVDFEGLRAIPWVFAWTQTRYLIPGWYGTGAALYPLVEADGADLEALRRMYRTWPFFQAVVDSAQREMARARLEIAREYAAMTGENGKALTLHDRIAEDFERARKAILAITGQENLLDSTPVIQKSISLRNPYTDVLNLVQITLMQRARRDGTSDRLGQALFHSINGIAAAMQSTG